MSMIRVPMPDGRPDFVLIDLEACIAEALAEGHVPEPGWDTGEATDDRPAS